METLMPEIGIHGGQLVMLLLLLFVTIFAAVARKIQVPYPIVLVIAGLLLGFVPGIPPIALEPDLIFLVVLPPLLFASAWVTSWRDLSRNMVSIAMLAPGLVAFTVLAVAGAAEWLRSGLRLAFWFRVRICRCDDRCHCGYVHRQAYRPSKEHRRFA